MTPPLHELEGQRHGLRYVYRPIEFPRPRTPRIASRACSRCAAIWASTA
ncbi:hypothetical protein [Nesterenkonia pannonica]|nr:hypothetical protein [Nesterenkonia pannonica]